MSNPAASFTGSIPENYDAGLGPVLFADWAREIALRAAALAPASVLELAAGTGIVSRQLRDQLPAASRLVISDLNPPMLEIAAGRFKDGEAVEIESADAMDLHYADDSFDLVLCQFGVMFFPDKARSHAEVLRVLKPGGSYLFTTWDSLQVNGFANTIHETICDFFPDNPPGFYKVPFGYHDRAEIASLMRDCGFDAIEVTQESLPARIASAAQFSRGLVYGNPLYQEVLDRGGEPELLRAALEQAIDTRIGAEIDLGVVVALGRK